MSKQSEFGRGFILCLVKFAGHFMWDLYLHETPIDRARSSEMYGGEAKLKSSRHERWANGASDHLYEIVAPEGEKWDGVREKVKVLKDLGLKMGHGFTDRVWTDEDRQRLVDLTYEIAVEADAILGVEAEVGQW